jgi:hypothetical protein
MPSVFLSYSRDDLPRIEQLEALLKTHPEISIWRDQDKIYGGQKWPKVLGEAIADQDVLLLVWSRHSPTSHFVEFEWTTAIALKKTLIPCLLDSTSLPPSLAATQGIPVSDTPKIIAALIGTVPTEDAGRRAEVVRKLSEITATKPEDALTAAKPSSTSETGRCRGMSTRLTRSTYRSRPRPFQKTRGIFSTNGSSG